MPEVEIRNRLILVGILVLISWTAVLQADLHPAFGQPADPSRPTVFAGSLDERARVLFVGFDRNLWLAYDTERGDIYKAWQGNLDDPYSRAAFYQALDVSVEGLVYHENLLHRSWYALEHGIEDSLDVSYQGYRISGPQVVLQYLMKTPSGEMVYVEERPALFFEGNRPRLQRVFHVYDRPPGVQLGLHLSVGGLARRDDVESDGLFQQFSEKRRDYYWGEATSISGRLVLQADTSTALSIFFSPSNARNLQETLSFDLGYAVRLRPLSMGDTALAEPELVRRSDHEPGIALKAYSIEEPINQLSELAPGQLPNAHRVIPEIDLSSSEDFGDLDFYFITHLSGYLNLSASGEYAFRVLADDGIRLTISDSTLIEQDVLQAAVLSEPVTIPLDAGIHPIRIEHFQSTGKKQLTVLWQPPWEDEFAVLDAGVLSTRKEEQRFASSGRKFTRRQSTADTLDVETVEVDGIHPALRIEELPVAGIGASIGGMAFLPDGRLAISTWEGSGRVIILEGDLHEPARLTLKEVASGLRFPLGLAVDDDNLYIVQRHELTHLIDLDGNELIDEYRSLGHEWVVASDYLELAYGLEYRDSVFVSALGMPWDRNGAILIEDIHHRGMVSGQRAGQALTEMADGFHIPNGLSMNDEGVLAIADQRNLWFSDSRLVFTRTTAGWRESPDGLAGKGSIWLPSRTTGRAPTEPLPIEVGPYRGQWLVGDMFEPILTRIGLDEVDGTLQGAVFPFTNNLGGSISRFASPPGGGVIAGGVAVDTTAMQVVAAEPAFQQFSFMNETAFEMKTIRLIPGGLAIEFTDPVDRGAAAQPDAYRLYQWPDSEVQRDLSRKRSTTTRLRVADAEVLGEGRTVELDVPSLQAGHVIYINLDPTLSSAEGARLWSNEAWYSLNRLRENWSTGEQERWSTGDRE